MSLIFSVWNQSVKRQGIFLRAYWQTLKLPKYTSISKNYRLICPDYICSGLCIWFSGCVSALCLAAMMEICMKTCSSGPRNSRWTKQKSMNLTTSIWSHCSPNSDCHDKFNLLQKAVVFFYSPCTCHTSLCWNLLDLGSYKANDKLTPLLSFQRLNEEKKKNRCILSAINTEQALLSIQKKF